MQFEKDDETGKAIIPYDFDSQAWTSPDAETKFGEFTDAKLTEMIAVKQMCVADIALVSGIPPSYFNIEQTGVQAISGEALRKLEARFTAIVQDAQRSFGETWSEVVRLALKIENGTAGDTMGEIEVQWTDAAPIGDGETLDNLNKKKTLGWSTEQLMRDYGLTDKQITEMTKENDVRAQADMERQQKIFDSGPPLA
jgi:SPP1 Gp6-like portal protein